MIMPTRRPLPVARQLLDNVADACAYFHRRYFVLVVYYFFVLDDINIFVTAFLTHRFSNLFRCLELDVLREVALVDARHLPEDGYRLLVVAVVDEPASGLRNETREKQVNALQQT